MMPLPRDWTHSPIDARENGCEPLAETPNAAAAPGSGVLPTGEALDLPQLEAMVRDALAGGDLPSLRRATVALRAADALARRHETMGPRPHRLDAERLRQLLAAVREAEEAARSKVEASATAVADVVDAADVARLLDAADRGAAHVRLDVEVESLVARSLASQERHLLRAASIALRVYERAARDGGRRIPPRVVELLGQVRAAQRAGRVGV